MKPLGLKAKKDGELMLVHKCLGCGHLSANRIAGDDNTYSIMEVFRQSLLLLSNELRELELSGYPLLSKYDEEDINLALFGSQIEPTETS